LRKLIWPRNRSGWGPNVDDQSVELVATEDGVREISKGVERGKAGREEEMRESWETEKERV
jgi:hypothetical protein